MAIECETEPLNLSGGLPDYGGLGIVEGGGVSSARGFAAAGIHAGFRADPQRLDMALVVADEPCACAATFTQNVFCAAPVTVSRNHLDGVSYGTARALVVNSGVANAATGGKGLEAAEITAEIVGDAIGCPANEVMVASTGVIGVHLNLETFRTGAPQAVAALSPAGGASAARAIMTTDTHPKEFAVTFPGDGIGYDGYGRAFDSDEVGDGRTAVRYEAETGIAHPHVGHASFEAVSCEGGGTRRGDAGVVDIVEIEAVEGR